ncbi:hypothetical protein WG66_001369 [Moniliophthora roreri]|uniref:Uncharacterized protein n=1 Tax=Moniliophthora roreri TaxID=221103 RepID=A0A0W0F0E9_MONRR|nr:hypothetical protein WG66_001369 [Moniliophthora roreri]
MQAARAVLYSIIEDILSTKHPDLRFVETVWKNSKDSDGAWGWHDRGSTENQETIRIDGNLLENVARLLDEHGLGIHESGGMDEYYPILLLYIMTELHDRAHYIIPESLPSIRNTLKSVGGVYNSRVTIGEFRFCSGRTTSRGDFSGSKPLKFPWFNTSGIPSDLETELIAGEVRGRS